MSDANSGKLRFRNEDDQQLWHECSSLVTNCIISYKMAILSRLWAHKAAGGDTRGTALLIQISSIAWQHINFYRRYKFTKEPEPINLDAMVEALGQCPIVPVEEGGEP